MIPIINPEPEWAPSENDLKKDPSYNPVPMENSAALTEEEIKDRSENYVEYCLSEVERVVVEEIEKREGRAMNPEEINRFGVRRLNPDKSMSWIWRGVLLVTMTPDYEKDGKKGTHLEIHRWPEKKADDAVE